MKGKTKTQKGITLVALIITIVILLILAAVAVSTIQNDGILSRANGATTKYNQKVGEEGVALGDLYDSLDPYFPSSESGSGSGSGEVVDPETPGSGEEGETPEPETPTITWTWTQSGITVTGTPSTGEAVTVAVGTTVTGYDAGVDSYAGGWVVLGAKNGKLLIVSTTNVQENVKLEGAEDYLNKGADLHTICADYKNEALADEARSIEIEDIDRITGYNPAETVNGTPYSNGNLSQYGNIVTYKLDANGNVVATSDIKNETSTTTSFTMPDNTVLTADMTEGIPVEADWYSYYPHTLTSSSTGTTNGISKSSLAYTTIFSPTKVYWLASTYNNVFKGHVVFGLRCINTSGMVSGSGVWYTSNGSTDSTKGVRAVVSLKSNISINSTGTISQ